MKIHGLQKMTLLDFPGHVACTVFLGGCDFRCPFCHNFELADGTAKPVMDEEALLSFLSGRKGLLDGVAFTGGEPCLHREGLPSLIRKIRDMGFAVKLDTNGYHPAFLKELLSEGLLDYVAMDIKNSPEKYAQTAGVPEIDLSRIRESIALLMESGIHYEFRTTLIDEFHEEEDVRKMGEMIRGADRYFLQAFTDRDTVPFAGLHAPETAKIQRFLEIARGFVASCEVRGVDE